MVKQLFIIPGWNEEQLKGVVLSDTEQYIDISILEEINLNEYNVIKLFGEAIDIPNDILDFLKTIKKENEFDTANRISYLPTWALLSYEEIINKLKNTDKPLSIFYTPKYHREILNIWDATYHKKIVDLISAGKVLDIFYTIKIKNIGNTIEEIEYLKTLGLPLYVVFDIEEGDDLFFNSMSNEDFDILKAELEYSVEYNPFVDNVSQLFQKGDFLIYNENNTDMMSYLTPLSTELDSSYLPGYKENKEIHKDYYTLGRDIHFSTFYLDATLNKDYKYSEINKSKYNTLIYNLKKRLRY